MASETTTETYLALVEELQALKAEEVFDYSVRHLQWAHMWGKTIRDHFPKGTGAKGREVRSEYLTHVLPRLAVDVGRSVPTLKRYIRLYDMYPDVSKALNEGEGKNINIKKLIGEPTKPAEFLTKSGPYSSQLLSLLGRLEQEKLTPTEKRAVETLVNAIERLGL